MLSKNAMQKLHAMGWPYLTRWTQAGKVLHSNFFMPLCWESQGRGGVEMVRLRFPPHPGGRN